MCVCVCVCVYVCVCVCVCVCVWTKSFPWCIFLFSSFYFTFFYEDQMQAIQEFFN